MCTKVCYDGGEMGVQQRSRQITQASAHGGQGCAAFTEEQACNTLPCPPCDGTTDQDCAVSSWGAYGACSQVCDGGTQTRFRSITAWQICSGTACPEIFEQTACNTHGCPVDCVVGAWEPFSACDVTCGTGHQTSTRPVTTAPANGGLACPAVSETVACYRAPCAIDCVVSTWGSFSTCSTGCGTGEHARTRTVLTPSAHGGADCPTLNDVGVCGTQPCAVNCAVTAFGPWASCDKSCGGGQAAHSRSIVTAAAYGGTECPALVESVACNVHNCPVDCAVSSWGAWGSCSVSLCGGGHQSRARDVAAPAVFGGVACPALGEQQSCNTNECPIHCVVGDWAEFSACSQPCGGGTRTRTREVAVAPQHGGTGCAALDQTQACNTAPCAVHCVAEFEPWTACTKSCGTGTRKEPVVVTTPAAWGGDACPSAQEELCNTFHCSTLTPTPAPTPPTPAPTEPTAPTPAPGQPLLQLQGADSLTVEARVGALYTDAGATCSDSDDGFIVDVDASGSVFPNLEAPATYTLEFSCHNALGTAATAMLRHVYVRDTECPACSIADGPGTVEASFAYQDAGASCSDSLDGALSHTATGAVDTEAVGTYTITYRAQDGAGNWNDGLGQACTGARSYVRTVHVVDTLQPVVHVHYRGNLVAKSAADGTGVGGQPNPVATYASAANLMAEAAAVPPAYGGVGMAAAAGAVVAVLAAWVRRRRGSSSGDARAALEGL